MSLIKKKICLAGDIGVGKTSLIRRYVENLFADDYLTTIGVNISQKKIRCENGQSILLLIWDVEGFHPRDAVSVNYYTGAAGVIMVADLTRLASIEMIPSMLKAIKKTAPNAESILVGNKTDLVNTAHPGYQSFLGISRGLGLPYYTTSAKNGQNVEKVFQHLTTAMRKETC